MKAKDYVKETLKPGETVRLEYGAQRADKYRRMLYNIDLSNGEMLNEKIVAVGCAVAATFPPNVGYQSRFLAAQQSVRVNRLGLWSDDNL